jgi:hypothetical protein
MIRGWLLILALAAAAPAVTPADQSVLTALGRAAPGAHTAVIRRSAVGNELDLVVALASAQPSVSMAGGRYWWGTKDRLGLFLQSRADADRVYRLAVVPGPNDDCAMAIERITGAELVLSCIGEKWATYDNRKFLFDVRSKALVKQFAYAPFHAVEVGRGPRILMNDGQRTLQVTVSAGGEWQVAAATASMEAKPAEAFGPGRRFRLASEKNRFGSEYRVIAEGEDRYELPQSDFETWRQARSDYVGSRPELNPDEKNEQIGPHQAEAGRLWFGRTFYDSEGLTGVGGIGYFDCDAREFRLFSPPEIQRWSASAILVEPEAVWLGLFRRGEYGDAAGGLLRWDRQTEQAGRFKTASIVTGIVRRGETLYMGATDGLLVLRGDQMAGYFIDRTSGGAYRVVPRTQ